MSHPLIAKAATRFFGELNKRNIKYAVMRKAERIPDDIGNDVDVLVAKRDEGAVAGIIGDCAKELNFHTYTRRNAGGLYVILYAFIGEELAFLRLDFTNPVKDGDRLLGARVRNEKGIYHLPAGAYEKKKDRNLRRFFNFPKRFLCPPGKFVVVVGPDGVGKSTTAELVKQLLEAFHIPVSHMHLGFRPRILPTKKALMSLGKKQHVQGEESKVPGPFRFLYHMLDHFLGYWFVIRPLLVKGKTVIGERYCYSYLVDPRPRKRYGVPGWVLRGVCGFMPKPDVVVLLSNDPEAIHERRQEHSVEEIARQLEAYRREGMRAKAFLETGTEKPATEVAMKVAAQLVPKKYRLAIVASHPIQYQSPLWRRIAAHPDIDLVVYYCVKWGVDKPQFHKDFFGTSYKWDIPLLADYRFTFLRNYSLKPRPRLGGFINPGIFWKLWKYRYDAVLIMGWMDVTFWFAFLAAKFKGMPAFLRVVNSSRYDRRIKRPKSLLAVKRAYLWTLFHWFVSAFLAIGTWNREMYLEYGIPPERIFHFPYAVWNEFFMGETERHRKNAEAIRRELGIGPRTKVITYAARFVEEKHPEHVVRVYEKVKDMPDTVLLMIGDGALRASLEQETKEKGLKNVKFLGFKNQTELVRLYAVTDIFVRTDAPIKGDWGATVNEAMACGLPVIAPDTIGAQADLVRQGENGFTYPFGDINALAGFMQKLLADGKLVESMKRRSREIIEKWSYEEDVEGLVKALGFCIER